MVKFLHLFFLIIPYFISINTRAQVWKKQAKSGNAGLTDVAFVSKANGFVLSSGKVLKTTDTGKTWTQILSGYNRFSRIIFTDATNGFIIGNDDLVLKTSDGGSNWTLKRTGNSDDDLLKVFAIDNDTVFVLGPDNLDNNDSGNYLEYTYNGGNSWARHNLNSKQTLSSLHMWNKNNGFIGLQLGGVFQTTNGFSSYSKNNNPAFQITDSKVIQDSIIVMVGNGGKIARSDDYGKTYKSITSPTSENLRAVHFANDGAGMACGEMGTILMTTNSGISWTIMTTNTKLNFTKIYVINPYLAWAVAFSTSSDSLDIFKYEDKSCLSSFVRVPRDTVICDKYDYETGFKIKGANKPSWTINDALTHLSRTNDTIAKIYTIHEGKFIISFELQNCEETLNDTATVFFWRNPTININDSLYCGSVSDKISFSCFACQYLWSNNDNSYDFVATQPGKFWVRATNLCKSISDTFTLSLLPYLKLDIGRDTLLCNQEKLILKNALSPGKYRWNDGDTGSTKIISKAGKYFTSFVNKCNNLSDTITVNYKKTPILDLGPDSLHCLSINHPVSLDSVQKFSTIKWNDGNTNYTRTLSLPGKYVVTLMNECGVAIDSIKLYAIPIPLADLGKDTIYCQNFKHTIFLSPKTSIYNVEWWDKDNSGFREFTSPGTYSVKVFNQCGEMRDTIFIDKKSIPKVNLGKDTSLIKPFSLQLNAKNDGSEYKWSIGPTSPIITVTDFGKYWVTVKNYCGSHSDTITIYDKAGFKQFLKNKSIRVYPNPVTDGNLFVENLYGDFNLEIFDQFGNKVLEKNIQNNYQTIDIARLCKGIYFLNISKNGGLMEGIRVLKL